MANRAKHLTHVISLGDAFYMDGIKNEEDPRFDASWRFADVAPTIARAEWLSVLGNHDCRGNISALVSLGSRPNRHNFRLPARYYSKSLLGSTLFAFLDTCSLVCGGDWAAFEPPDVLEEVHQVLSAASKEDAFDDAQRRFPATARLPFGINGTLARAGECLKLPTDSKPDPKAQLEWLDALFERHQGQVAARKQGALSIVVIGHSPLFSAGVPLRGHGDYPQLIARLQERFSRSNVGVYFSGDEHSMQVLEREKIKYVVSGSGGGLDLHLLRPDASVYEGLQFAESSLGFSSLTRIAATGDLVLTLFRVRPDKFPMNLQRWLPGFLGRWWLRGFLRGNANSDRKNPLPPFVEVSFMHVVKAVPP